MNIIGEGLQRFVSEQINTRQTIYGSINRTAEQLLYLNSRTAFVKLVSAINLTDKFNPASAELKSIAAKYGSNNLAKEFILFGGVSDINNTPRKDINRTGNLINNSAAYGVGGLEFGFRPMPGIVSAEIKTESMGSLKTGIITLKAWNRTQFEIIDLLYLRLGYGILLEWGNTLYFKDINTLVGNNEPPISIAKEFLDGNLNVTKVLNLIQEKRRISCGNYDALFGKVVNFNWSFENDGSYNIVVIIRSIGDIIEGIKCNVLIDDVLGEITSTQDQNNTQSSTSSTTPPSETTTPPSIESYKDKHQFGRLAYIIKTAFDRYPRKSNGCLSFGNIKIGNNDLILTSDIASERNFLVQQYQGNKELQYYIRLGAFLNYIQYKVVYKYKKNGDTEPTLKFDYDTKSNVIYAITGTGTINQISADPNVCVIKTQLPFTNGNTYYYAPEGQDYLTNIGGVGVGQVMNIYINIRHILNLLDNLADNKGAVSLISFLKQLLDTISIAIGGTNNLKIYIEEETYTVKIIDENPLANKNEVIEALRGIKDDDTTIKLNLYGYYNNNATPSAGFVKNFGFKTALTPDLAHMLSIGAQAAGSVVGQDSTALSKLNEGIEDRIKPAIIDAYTLSEQEETKEDKLVELNERYPNASKNFSKALIELGSQNNSTIPTWNAENIINYSNLQLDFVSYNAAKTAIKTNKGSNHIGFIPVSLELNMDGLSGIRIYNALRVDTAYLPSNYPSTMDFIIVGVGHTISDNVWNTNISTIMVPKNPSQAKGQKEQSIENNSNSRGSANANNPRASDRNRNCAQENQQLSPNYTLSQLSCGAIVSSYFIPLEGETKKHIRGNFTRQQIINNLKALVQNIAEPIKAKFPSTIITSGYRNKGNNSQHEIGEAIDIQFTDIVGTIPNQNSQILKRAQEIKKILDEKNGYDQFLLEYKTTGTQRPWIHISYRNDRKNRKEIRTFLNDTTAPNGNGIFYNPLV